MRANKSSDPGRIDREQFTLIVGKKISKPGLKHVDSIVRFFLDEMAKRAKDENGFKIPGLGTLKIMTKPPKKIWNEHEKEYQMSKELKSYVFVLNEDLAIYLEKVIEVPEKERYLRNRHKFK